MCGDEYCGVCETHAKENGIEAWAKGHIHEKPVAFGDLAQKRTAERRRVQAWQKLQREAPLAAMCWPEFKGRELLERKFLDRLIRRLLPNFDGVIVADPRFFRFVAECPFRFYSRQKTRRQRHKEIARMEKRWKRDMIAAFIGEYGSERMWMFCEKLEMQRPWWDIPDIADLRVVQAA